MAWIPQRAYFAVIALVGDREARAAREAAGIPPLVLLTGDDFSDLLNRRATLVQLRPGCPLQVVWALDGAPVTREQYEQMLYARARPAGTSAPGPLGQLPPVHPRLLRPEINPTPKPEPPPRELLMGEAPPAVCRACQTRARNLLVAGEPPPCDSPGHHAPNEERSERTHQSEQSTA